MKFVYFIAFIAFLASCGVKVPFTDDLKKEYELNNAENMKKVQFYTSTTIILEQNETKGAKPKTEEGTLVTSKNKIQNRLIIPVNTKCIFDSYDSNGNVNIRFELGQGKTIKFGVRENQVTGRYYFVADWSYDKGGEVLYGGEKFYATSNSGNAFLLVVIKKLQKTRRKDRVVKGLKV
ncbi:MAG: hypothetical protein KA264_03965 [Crocinitomicaceae bacterium]|jgi:hypothetical protein|nr:hypothetical protein [Crocinitomicaceae bacterium]